MVKRRTPDFYEIDSTRYSAVVACQLCAWRASGHTKASMYRLVADHLRRAHGAHTAAAHADESAGRWRR